MTGRVGRLPMVRFRVDFISTGRANQRKASAELLSFDFVGVFVLMLVSEGLHTRWCGMGKQVKS